MLSQQTLSLQPHPSRVRILVEQPLFVIDMARPKDICCTLLELLRTQG